MNIKIERAIQQFFPSSSFLVDKKYPLHGALKEAFKKLYGYTSDAGGIRHGSLDLANVDYDLAKYMLVSCSAFINYLISKSN